VESTKRRRERTCLGCRQTFRQEKLLRFVLGPDGRVLVDYRGKLPGRGAYTCLDPGCIKLAVARKQFARAFKTSIMTVSYEDMISSLREQILARILNLLGMARKSSNAVSGSNAVLTALSGREFLFLIFIATDVSAEIGTKIENKASYKRVPCYRLFNKNLMGKLMGRSERSVVAIRNELLAESIKAELCRLESFAGEG
jgi:hypothetical protein